MLGDNNSSKPEGVKLVLISQKELTLVKTEILQVLDSIRFAQNRLRTLQLIIQRAEDENK